jgi:mannose-1-phosphate guanylyltransferase
MRYAVVLAGGWGERLWPMSTRSRPKQLLALGGGPPLVSATVRRIAPLVSLERSLVLTGAGIRERIVPEVGGIPSERIIGEPVGRNTAPAIALAAHLLVRDDPDAVMAVLPADHLIEGADAFRGALSVAFEAAERAGVLVTLGITPTRPETEYGYIQAPVGGAARSAVPVKRFVEKPDAATAARYLEEGGYYWNSGIFVWRGARFLDEVARLLPRVAAALGSVMSGPGEPGFSDELARFYAETPSISVDYGVMEKADDVLVVPAGFTWDDVGAWSALARVWPLDDDANAVAVGMDGVVVAPPAGATLVCPRDRVRDVRRVVEELKRRGAIEP